MVHNVTARKKGCMSLRFTRLAAWALTASLFGLCVLSLAYFDDLTALAEGVLATLTLVQGLAGYDAVDFWSKSIR